MTDLSIHVMPYFCSFKLKYSVDAIKNVADGTVGTNALSADNSDFDSMNF
jgi:hypothetical protein